MAVPELKEVRSAARALYTNSNSIPQQRAEQLRNIICQHLRIGYEELTADVLQELKDISCL